ncbi:Cytoskeleton-associated protein 5 [Schistosoma japonicum]|nr:Cytoskeleton-associated protein 5 [Schistosoma japonicum]
MSPECSKLDENTLTKLESSSWQERKEVLEIISNQLRRSTITSSTCCLLTKALCQVITSDKHSMLVTRAASVLSELVESMGNGFTVYAERALTACLLKFKDNKSVIAQALHSAATAIVDTMSFDLALVHLQSSLSTPVARTQAEALRLLTHLLCKSTLRQELQLSQRLKISKPLLSNIVKFSEHKTLECRDACFQVFAAVRIFLDFSSKQFDAIIDNMLDESRRIKVDAAFLQLNEGLLQEKIPKSSSVKLHIKSISKNSRVQQQLVTDSEFLVTPITASPRVVNSSVKVGKQSLQRLPKNPIHGHLSSSTPFAVSHKSTKQNVKVSTPTSGMSKVLSSVQYNESKQRPLVGKIKTRNKNIDKPKSEKWLPPELNLSPSQLRTKLSETYFINVPLEQFTDSAWKIRLQIAERIHAIINSDPPEFPDIHYLLQYILHCGTLKDSNFRVRCEVLRILSKLLSQNKSQNWISSNLELLCDQLFTTIGDSKSGPLVEQTLLHLMNVIGFSKTVECINTGLKKQISSTVQSSLIKWLSSAIKSLDSSFDHILPIEIVKFGLSSSAANVRSSAIELAGAIHSRLHSTVNIRSFFASEKPAILQRLESEFASNDKIDRNNSELSDSKSCNSTFSGLQTPAAIVTWSAGHRRMAAVIRSISPSQRLTNAQGVLEFSDSDESPVTERTSVPYRKGVIEAVTRQPAQLENVHCNVTCKSTYMTIANTYDTLFFIESNDEISLLQTKEVRLENLRKHKNISKDELQHLFNKSHAHPSLMKNLFSASYEGYLEALNRLISSLDKKDMYTVPSPLIVTYAHFDLILIWIVEYSFGTWLDGDFRQAEYNSYKTVLAHTFEYLTAVISLFAQNDLRLSEQEVNIVLIPLLNCQLQSLVVYKDPIIYRAASDLMRFIRQVYPPSLLMDILVKYMHHCSTARMRQICLDELLNLIPRSGDPRGFTSEICLKLIAQQIADSDSGVKKSALNCLYVAYQFLGPLFWQHIGNLPEKDKKVLEQHLSSNTEATLTILDKFDEFQAKTPFKIRLTNDTPRTVPYTRECCRTKRPESPPPLYLSPAAPSLLLPLITARDNPSLSESERTAASSQLSAALSCLVEQLGGCFSEDQVQDENCEPTAQVYIDENEDDRSDFNNIVLGALIDLEVLIQDPRTRDLLPPFMPHIICQLTLLCDRLYKSESNAGQAIFLDCLGGELMCIFTQPFLFREIKADNLKYLLGGLIQLAERLQLNRNTPSFSANPRIMTIMKLVRYIYTAVDPSVALSVLLRLVHICCFGCDTTCPQIKPECQDNRSNESCHFIEPFSINLKSISFSKVANLSLAQLSCRISEIRNFVNKLDWALILPLLEPFIPNSSGVTKSIKVKSHHSVRIEILQKTVKVIQNMLIEIYSRIGSKFVEAVENYGDQCPSLLHLVYKMKGIMPDAPYPHCFTETDQIGV